MQNNAYQQMAKEFMDLWQKQISAVISDKQFIQAMLELFQSAQNAPNDQHPKSTAHPAHAADADHGSVAELAFRLAMCEKRLAALEQQTKKPAAQKPPKSKPIGRGKQTRSKATGKRPAGRSVKPRG